VAKTVFFHLGLHKTATSWLQRRLFPTLAIPVIRTRKFERIERFIAQQSASKILISHEGLGGRIGDDKAPGDSLRMFQSTIERIARLPCDGKVVIGFREHIAWINSAYAQRDKKAPVTPQQYRDSYSLDDLLWMRRTELCDQYGLQSFLFLYEEFANESPAPLADLCEFIGIPLPNGVGELLANRENPSPRTERGVRISRVAYKLAKAIDGLPWLNDKRLREAAFRIGAYFDSDQERRPKIGFATDDAERLQCDWKELVLLISERRGRDLSTVVCEAQRALTVGLA
jgi:hypothetical protein